MSEHLPVPGRIEHPDQLEIEDYIEQQKTSEAPASDALAQGYSTEVTRMLRDVERAFEFAKHARSAQTRRTYQSQFNRFVDWCEARNEIPMPASDACVAAYLASRAEEGTTVATLKVALSAINQAHKRGGFGEPRSSAVVREVFSGIRRQLGTRERRVSPITVDLLRQTVRALPTDTIKSLRDRALLTLGFAGAFRRSELVALDVTDLKFVEAGLEVLLRRSKSDQEGEGVVVGIPMGSDELTCPVRSVRAWINYGKLKSGPLFRSTDRGVGPGRLSTRTVARIVKEAVEAAGLDPNEYSGHSLRAGLATSAAKAGKPERIILKHGRWKTRDLLDRYVRDADLFSENAAAGIGL